MKAIRVLVLACLCYLPFGVVAQSNPPQTAEELAAATALLKAQQAYYVNRPRFSGELRV